MNLLVKGALPPLDVLREQWRSASLASVWLYADDWYSPAVDAVLESLAEGRPTEPSCEDLGFARADAACGIGEAIDDLTCLFTAISHPVPGSAVRALTVGWVDGQTNAAPPMSCVEASSGLHTLEYFIVRLQETYSTRTAPHAPSESLLFIDVGLENLPLGSRIARSAGMGHTLRSVFGDGRPVAVLGGGYYVALATADDSPKGAEESLIRRIERNAAELGISGILRRPPRVWRETLPATHAAAAKLLTSRRRR